MTANVLVIGASGDIGKAIVRQLIKDGKRVLLQYFHNRKAVNDLQTEISNEQWLGAIQADLTTSAGITGFIGELFIQIDAVVFAGGASVYGLFQDMDEEVMDRLYHLHVKTPWLVTRHLLPGMIQRKGGHILVISSVWGSVGASMEVLYSSVKGAQDSFVKALAKEAATSNVSVNGIGPGYIETKMNNIFNEEEKAAIIESIPSGRPGLPEEIAALASFLMSEKASYIRGEIIKIDGAWC
ncbi:elongation factor P 5-aminopentanone reductase [Thalassobacillus pellis]|uniref:elongation factor P 5-aminopentanone reductase n=1 Tax=Thalassobacillus pellis TaxID=748008 RepID=UPI001961DBAA|nr:3-oxoacyl-[acyl-carrier protein] reductase [Thalassobacillus pellis]